MIRHVAAITVALCVAPALLHAQTPVFVVNTASANVHKAPTTASVVIGHAARGARLEVARELGSWVKIAWPAAPEGVGYVHVSTGAIARANSAAAERHASAAAVDRRADTIEQPSDSARATASPAGVVRRGAPAATRVTAGAVPTPRHAFGVGGHIGAPGVDLGGSARAWSQSRFGVQAEVSRAALVDDPGRVNSLELAASAMFALRDRVTDYWWLRPYVGAGPMLARQTFDAGGRPGDPLADHGLGFQAFGGAETTFAGAPQFAVSIDIGYRWLPAPFTGFDRSGVRVDVSGHWYLK